MTKGSKKDYTRAKRYAEVIRTPHLIDSNNQLLQLSHDAAIILSLEDFSVVEQNDNYTELLSSSGFTSRSSLLQIIPRRQPNGCISLSIFNEHKNKLLATNKSQRFKIYINNLKKDTLQPIELTISRLQNLSSLLYCTIRQIEEDKQNLSAAQSNTNTSTSGAYDATILNKDQAASTQMLLQKIKEYKSIIDTAPAAIIKTDTDGNINFVSSQATFIHGLAQEELIHNNIDSFFNINGKSLVALLKRKLDNQKKGEGRKTVNISHPTKGERVLELKYFPLNTEESKGYLLSYIDVSDKEKFKSSLEHSNAKLDSIIGLSKSDIIQLSMDGTIETFSSNFNTLVLEKQSKIIGQNFQSFLLPASKDLFVDCLNILKNGENENVSELFEIKLPEQEKTLIHVFGKKLIDKSNNKENILFVCHNYTDTIKSEIALIEKESTVHTLLENSPFSIYAIDRKLNVIFINNNAIEDFKTFQKINIKLGDNLNDIVPKESLISWKNKIFKRVFNGEKFSRTGLIKGTNDVIIENRYAPLLDHFGNVSGCVEVSQDITDLKLKEYQLIEREAYLSSILNSSPHGIVVFDYDNIVTGINPKAIDNFITLYDKKLDINSDLKSILPAQEFEVINQIRKRVFKGEVVSFTEKFITSNQTFYYDYVFSPVKDKSNTIIGCKLQLIDETKVIEFEDILREKNRELERYIESNLSLENFANIASHDLKSPLRTIIGFTQLLERDIFEKLSAKNKVFMAHIIKSSKSMQALIDDILLFSKLNSVKPTIEEIPLKAFIEFIISQLQDEIDERHSIIRFENFPKYIYSDRVKLAQVLQNLIRNGIKFQAQNNQPKITISVEDLNKFWHIHVTDNGIGIEQKNADKIFQIFKRLHHKADYAGTGIGLSTCQKLIESLGGKIWVNSEFGKGSTFSFSIPK